MSETLSTSEGAVARSRVEGAALVLEGDWTQHAAAAELASLPAELRKVELSGVEKWDSTLPAVLLTLKKKHKGLEISGASANLLKLLELSGRAQPAETLQTRPPMHVLQSAGKRYRAAVWLDHAREAALSAVSFLGEIFIHAWRLARNPKHFRPRDWFVEFEEAGHRALPIVAFLSFLVGLILAFVSSMQLRLFGASIYVADLVGLSMTREMGALMTAIIMAGRTGAAYAARIGSMKRSEELDALKTMGLSGMDMVVLPKVAALTAMTPLLTVCSTFVGMFAGLLMATIVLELSVFQYISETALAVVPRQLVIGIAKGAVYGFLVAYAGAWRGMRCGDSADAVGQAATSAVVMSLTLIVTANAIFAVVLNALNL